MTPGPLSRKSVHRLRHWHLRVRWAGLTSHYEYFRKAEYPLTRLDALREAWRVGWCWKP